MADNVLVSLLIPMEGINEYRLLDGIANYRRDRAPHWSFYSGQERAYRSEDNLARVVGNGVIAYVTGRDAADVIKASGLPAVNVSAARDDLGLTQVIPDNVAVGRLAAEHFLARGHNNFGFCGVPCWFSRQRREGFESAVSEAGFECAAYQLPHRGWGKEQGKLEHWLASLAKPVGVLAVHDGVGERIISLCQVLGVRVPEELALVGVDNREVRCKLPTPPLSSVDIPFDRIGYEAAALLDRMMAGEPPPSDPVVVPPLGVATRKSSDILAVEDREVARVLRFIWDHAGEPTTVEEVLAEVAMSRRSLEYRFRLHVGRTPYAEIMRVHVERAKKLLAETKMPVHTIAAASGFKSASHLSIAFRRATGLSPREYRKHSLSR